VLLVLDPAAEEKFVAEGYGVQKREVMHNDVVLVGPRDDPATVKGEKSVAEAFARVARQRSSFVSRGDESGTHHKEKQVWRQAQVEPQGDWYIRAGAGMGQVLRMADQKQAYTLSDRATFLAQREGIDLDILFQGDRLLLNRYSVIVVSPEKHPHVRHQAAGHSWISCCRRKDRRRLPTSAPTATGSPFSSSALPANDRPAG